MTTHVYQAQIEHAMWQLEQALRPFSLDEDIKIREILRQFQLKVWKE